MRVSTRPPGEFLCRAAAIFRVRKIPGRVCAREAALNRAAGEELKKQERFLTQGDVTGDCQNQKALLVERKRKPDFVIKLLH